MLFNKTVIFFVLKKILSAYALLLIGVISVSMFAGSAYAQQPTGGMPVPIDASELFLGLMETNLIWILPVAVAGVVILKIKSKEN